jgi:hypothetical protein
MQKWFLRISLSIGIILLSVLIFLIVQVKDRFPGYKVDLHIESGAPNDLQVGFAALSITPEVPDTWTDTNNNAQYNPDQGDTYEDGNGNGQFDPVWIAGFQNRRPAQGVHDELWARTMVIDDGATRLALVALDCIGLGADDVIRIRKAVQEAAGVDYVIVSSSHTHEGPDVIGLWGGGRFKSGVDRDYLQFLVDQAARSVDQAVANLRPAKLRFAEDPDGAAFLVEDSRPPIVLDPAIRLMQAIDTEADTTLGTLVQWSNHPETLWSDNLLITSDFVHFLREGIEEGVMVGDSLYAEGLGGTTVFLNGAIGGLMTTSPSMEIPSLSGDTNYLAATFAKAKAQGDHLALLSLQALEGFDEISEGSIGLRAKSVQLPMANPLYRLGAFLGILNRGFSGWLKIRSEVCYWELGPASFLHQPGEIYPEIVNGGVEAPQGADFGVQPLETPPLRELMGQKYRFTVGLSNDMIGYIIPRSEWDQKAPFIYDYEEAPYGEINSVGPETAPILYEALKEIIQDVK